MQVLDFEKEVYDLEKQLEKARESSEKGGQNGSRNQTLDEFSATVDKLKKDLYGNLNGWQKVQLSRHPDRPYTLDYIQNITQNFIEMHGDRNVGDDKAMIGGFASIDGQTVMVIGQQKGRNTKQRQMRNFGMPNPEGYRKALRLMKLA